jgi:HSP20 family molecular chaperone IbpA
MTNTIATYQHQHPTISRRPGLLGSSVFDNVFDNLFNDSFPTMLRKSTTGYPVADIYRNEEGSTVMEFALAGFVKEELSIDIQPDNRSITVRATSGSGEGEGDNRRIARRSFEKTYVNYDNNLDISSATAAFENGLLTVMVPQRPEVKPLQVKIK